MENYVVFLNTMPLNETDKCICNYLLTDSFDKEYNSIESIFHWLTKSHSDREAYEIIVCGLYAIDIRVHHRWNLCCRELYERHKHELKEEKLFYIKIYRDCTDGDLIDFIEFIFNERRCAIDCVQFFQFVSDSPLPYDATLIDNAAEFRSQLGAADDGLQTDGKRRRLTHSPDDCAEHLSQMSLEQYYPIKEKRKNLCLIFNDRSRNGSDKDVLVIKETFERINGFTVMSEDIVSKDKLLNDIAKHCRSNSVDSDMIVCFFMSHGDNGVLYDQKENPLSHDVIAGLFTTTKVPSLAGKPKILIFQSCRGENLQEVIQFDSPAQENDPVTANVPVLQNRQKKKLPDRCDFFTIYSTMPGNKSLRDPEHGGLFIQKFCHLIRHCSKKLSIDHMCTQLNRDFDDIEYKGKNVTQLCEVVKTLTFYEIYLEKPDK